MVKKQSVSIIVPVYSGEKYLFDLFNQIRLLKVKWDSDNAPIIIEEVIFVNDKAIDNSSIVLENICNEFSWVTHIKLSKNFGQHPATIAGILYSSGDWIVTLDEDLQHPPSKIELLLFESLTKDLDIVYASSPVKHNEIKRDLSSVLFKKLMVFLTGDKNIVLYNSFRLIRGEIARSAASVCGHDTYFDISLSWFSSSIGKCDLDLYDTRKIDGISSGYSLFKLFSHAQKLLFTSKIRIFRIIALLGFLLFIFGIIYSSIVFLNEIFNPGFYGFKGWPSLIISTLIFGSISIVLLSLILEYLSIVVLKSQGKPVFFVLRPRFSGDILNYLNSLNADLKINK